MARGLYHIWTQAQETALLIWAPIKLHFGIRSLLPARGRPQKGWSARGNQSQLWSGKEKMREEGATPFQASCSWECRPEPEEAAGETPQWLQGEGLGRRTSRLLQRPFCLWLDWGCSSSILRGITQSFRCEMLLTVQKPYWPREGQSRLSDFRSGWVHPGRTQPVNLQPCPLSPDWVSPV